MGRLNHNRPIAQGDMMQSEWQRESASGKKNPPRGSMGGMLDIGCEFSEEALDARAAIFKKHGSDYRAAKAEIRAIRMAKNRATMQNGGQQPSTTKPKPPQDQFFKW